MVFLVLPSASILLAATLLAQSTAQSAGSQPVALPVLVLDSLPATVRRHVQILYEEAQARPGDHAAAGRLAMVLHAQEQLQSASVAYRRARHLDPRSFDWMYLAAVIQAKLGDFGGAASTFQKALALDPGYLPARLALAEALVQGGQLEEARGEYGALLRDYPELAVAHYGHGRVAAMLGDGAVALERYRKSVELAPEFGAAHYALALAYRDAGLAERVAAHLGAYRRLGARRPVPPDRLMERVNAFRSTARHLIVEGARLEEAGRIDESIARHVQALEADPAAAQAHVNLISLYGRKGEPDPAQRHYHAALKLQGDHAGAHYNWGVLQARAGRLEEAGEAFRRALEVDPFHPQAHNNLGTLLAAKGRLADAATHYQHTIANDPDHRMARFNLGRVLVALGRPREAAEQFERLLVPETTETPRVTYALATAWLAAGDIARAHKYGEQALEIARRLGQKELAAKIEADLQRMKQP
jgi:tetratricopeptide (TPR) repeat protein